ncbi:helix-turn-helix domain-containing protein [Streptomyces sp. 5.8]|uniref:helix-turn-helix domain-containing protein n=1 Tax=Streptomyces sp. 5.8 TaxID=3406571 RepID=UPI003BB5ADC1
MNIDLTKARAKRHANGWTVAYTAKRMGASESALWRWEAGERRISLENYLKLCRALRIPFSDLMADCPEDFHGELTAAEITRQRHTLGEQEGHFLTATGAEAAELAERVKR